MLVQNLLISSTASLPPQQNDWWITRLQRLMIKAVRRCAAAAVHVNQPCLRHWQWLLCRTAGRRHGRLALLQPRCISSAQQQAPSEVADVPQTPPQPLNAIEEAAAQLGGAHAQHIYTGRAISKIVLVDVF